MAHDKNASPQFIGALTELVWEQIKDVAVDTEAFARYILLAIHGMAMSTHERDRHAGRKNIEVSDALLLARRNEALADILKAHVEETKKAATTKS